MIDPKCKRCKEELDEPGAILLSPPDEDDQCDKIHLCKKCYKEVMKGIWVVKVSPMLKGDIRKSKHEHPTECIDCHEPLVRDENGAAQYVLWLRDMGTCDGAICFTCHEKHVESDGTGYTKNWPGYVYEEHVEYIYDPRKHIDSYAKKEE